MECAMNYENAANNIPYIEMVNCVIVVNFPNHDGAVVNTDNPCTTDTSCV